MAHVLPYERPAYIDDSSKPSGHLRGVLVAGGVAVAATAFIWGLASRGSIGGEAIAFDCVGSAFAIALALATAMTTTKTYVFPDRLEMTASCAGVRIRRRCVRLLSVTACEAITREWYRDGPTVNWLRGSAVRITRPDAGDLIIVSVDSTALAHAINMALSAASPTAEPLTPIVSS